MYARYLTVVLVFTLSGFLHQFASYSMGISLQESNAYVFFWITAVGLFVESVILKSMRGKPSGGKPQQGNTSQTSSGPPVWKKLLGYLWVLLWLGPAGSYLMFPTVTLAIVNPSVRVPYSLVEPFGLEKTGIAAGVGALVLKVFFIPSL